LFKHLIGNLNREFFTPFLSSFADLLRYVYDKNPSVDVLKTLILTISVYQTGNIKNINDLKPLPAEDKLKIVNSITNLFSEIAKKTFEIMYNDSFSRPDLFAQFYETLARSVDVLPEMYHTLGENVLSSYVDITLNAIPKILDRKAFKNMTLFIMIFITEDKLLKSVLERQFVNILKVYIETIPTTTKSFITDFITLLFYVSILFI